MGSQSRALASSWGGLSEAALSDLPKYDTRVYYIKPSAEGALREESLRRPPRQMPIGGHFGGRSDGRSAGMPPGCAKRWPPLVQPGVLPSSAAQLRRMPDTEGFSVDLGGHSHFLLFLPRCARHARILLSQPIRQPLSCRRQNLWRRSRDPAALWPVRLDPMDFDVYEGRAGKFAGLQLRELHRCGRREVIAAGRGGMK